MEPEDGPLEVYKPVVFLFICIARKKSSSQNINRLSLAAIRLPFISNVSSFFEFFFCEPDWWVHFPLDLPHGLGIFVGEDVQSKADAPGMSLV